MACGTRAGTTIITHKTKGWEQWTSESVELHLMTRYSRQSFEEKMGLCGTGLVVGSCLPLNLSFLLCSEAHLSFTLSASGCVQVQGAGRRRPAQAVERGLPHRRGHRHAHTGATTPTLHTLNKQQPLLSSWPLPPAVSSAKPASAPPVQIPVRQADGTQARRPPKSKSQHEYYMKLTRLFQASDNHLFHAYAWHKIYTLVRYAPSPTHIPRSLHQD